MEQWDLFEDFDFEDFDDSRNGFDETGFTHSPEADEADDVAVHMDDDLVEAFLRWNQPSPPPSLAPSLEPSRKPAEPSKELATEASWRGIRAGMRRRDVRGNDELVNLLSLLGSPEYAEVGPRTRMLVTAPPSAGKTFLAEAFAASSGRVYVQVDAGAIAVEGWAGLNVHDILTAIYQKAERDLKTMEQSVVLVLDEIDKATRHTDDDRLSSAVRADRQAAMLQLLWGGTPIRFSSGEKNKAQFDLEVRTDRWIVLACGSFPGADFTSEGREPTDAELIKWGMTPELASRLTTRVAMAARSADEIDELLRESDDGIRAARRVCERLGYPLKVTESAVARVARAIADGVGGLTLRVGAQLLVTAANRALIEALEEGAPQGTQLLVAPDDVPLPLRHPVAAH